MQLSKTEREEVVLAKEEKANLRAIKWMAVPYRHPKFLTPVLLHQCVRRAPVRKKPTHGRSTRWLSRPSVRYERQPSLDGALLRPGIACLRLHRSCTTSLTFTTVDEEDAAKQTSMALHWHTSIL